MQVSTTRRSAFTRARTVPAALLLAAVALCGGGGCAPMSFLITPLPASPALEEHVVQRESIWATRKVALIDVEGVITNSRSNTLLGGIVENPVVSFKEKLDKAARDEQIAAVVLRINSPGGGVTATDLMYEELLRFRKATGRPVIACLLDMAASGGYYLACGADRIIAHPTTVTGSIGVIMMTPDVSGAMAKLGIEANVIKSGDLKDSGSPFRRMTDADRGVFQSIINQMYERFVGVVATGRPKLAAEKVRSLADGRVFLAPEAKASGLVDEIGTLNDAIFAAKSAAGLADKAIVVVEYARSMDYRPNIYAHAAPGAPSVIQVALPDWLANPGPEFQYLWAPGWE